MRAAILATALVISCTAAGANNAALVEPIELDKPAEPPKPPRFVIEGLKKIELGRRRDLRFGKLRLIPRLFPGPRTYHYKLKDADRDYLSAKRVKGVDDLRPISQRYPKVNAVRDFFEWSNPFFGPACTALVAAFTRR